MTANVALTDSFDQWRVKTNEVVVMTQTDGMSNFIKVLDTTNSTSNTTGSIITAGGLGVLKSAVIGENLRVHGNVITDGDTTISGNLVFGDADTDQVSFSADINSNLIPNANLTFNIGNTTMFWANTWTGHVGVEQKSDSGKPAISVTSDDVDKDAVRITAGQDTGNVFHINARSLTTGTGITVLADALTTGSALTIDSDAGVGTRNVVEIINDNALAVGATPLYVKNDSTNTVAKFIGTSTIVLPVGTSSNRGYEVQGGIRYNTTTSSFEGYSGSQWGSLGGVIDVDLDTKIIAETSAGADNDDLDFFTAGTQRMKIDETGLITVGVDGTGYDVKFFGDTSGRYMLWDEDQDALHLPDDTSLKFGSDAAGDMKLYHNGSHAFIINKTGTLNIATATSGIAVSIGHTTSETTVNDNLTVTGNLAVGSDGTNYDVNFFGDTSGRDLSWNAGEDSLKMKDNVKIKMGTGDDINIYHDGTNSYISNSTGDFNINASSGICKLATGTSGIPVQIGHTTSETTVRDNLTVTGTLTELSMREMKTNISNMENILPSVLQMQGVQFDWKKDEDKGLNHYGFIAEDVDKILPNLVSHDEEGKAQGIQYSKMTAVLLEAIKEQQIQIDELKSKIN